MGIVADITEDWAAALAALAWQVEAGIDETLADAPIDRYDLAVDAPVVQTAPRPAPPEAAAPAAVALRTSIDAVNAATLAAQGAATLQDLHAALTDFAHCDLRLGARNTVFADGNSAARVLVLGEAPGREEDREGRPFTGPAGQMLDRMFAAIGLSRNSPDSATALYITNVLPWRPPGNRDPSADEIAMLRPFVTRHIELADPEVIVVMGNTPLICLTGQPGITRARGAWTTALGRPMLPMTHPAYLIRTPEAKRDAWADLLSLHARLRA